MSSSPDRVLALVVFVALTLSCTGSGGDAVRDDSPNVVLIVVDTLRADKLGCYGNDRGLTPRLDALAAESVVFQNAYAHAPWTLPSFASLITSLHPTEHGAGGYVPTFNKLNANRRTVAEVFRDAGYETASVVNVDFLTKTFGTTQGFSHVDFEVYPDNILMRNAGRTTDAALSWLDQPRKRPFLLLVHYFDPHAVYAPPPEFRKRFAAPEDRENPDWTFGTRPQIVAERMGKVRFDEATIRRAERLYDGEIAYTDQEVGRLLDGLRERGLREETVVVFTADHGEEFWDHGGFAHGHTLYEEQVHVPLIFSWPGRLAPRIVPEVIGHVDVAPTACELAGVEVAPEFGGASLTGVMAGEAPANRPVLIAGNFWGPPILGFRNGNYKLILLPDERVELYDVLNDPLELHDLSQAEPDRAERLLEDLRLAMQRITPNRENNEEPELTPEQLERLRSLGYVD